MPSVVMNMPRVTQPLAFAEFYFNSFVNTDVWVQAIAVGFMSLGAWFVRNTIRNLQAQKHPKVAHARS
jgi:hypothetical protein